MCIWILRGQRSPHSVVLRYIFLYFTAVCVWFPLLAWWHRCIFLYTSKNWFVRTEFGATHKQYVWNLFLAEGGTTFLHSSLLTHSSCEKDYQVSNTGSQQLIPSKRLYRSKNVRWVLLDELLVCKTKSWKTKSRGVKVESIELLSTSSLGLHRGKLCKVHSSEIGELLSSRACFNHFSFYRLCSWGFLKAVDKL